MVSADITKYSSFFGLFILYNRYKLADKNMVPEIGGCDIIICATRTGGKTVNKVDEIANKYDYHTLWISSFFSPHLDKNVLNRMASENVINIIKSLIVEQL
jgi:hypothetical protein